MTCRLIPILLIATLLLLPGCTSLSGLEQVSLVRPPLLDRELFFGDPEISSPELSPDGKYVAFIKPYRDARNIHVKQLDEAFEAATPITADERPVPGYFWSRDGRYVLYVQDKGGNENYHVYAVDPAGEIDPATGVPVARDLTPVGDVRARILSVPRNSPGEIIVGLNDRDPSLHDVYRVDLATGKRELLIENTEKVSSYFFDLEGNARLATRQTPDGSTEFLRVEGSRLTAIYECSYEETCRPYRFHKDGKHLYIVSNKGPDVDLTRLMLMDAKTGRTELVESDPEDQVDFGSASLSAATDELLATVYVGDRVRIYPQDDDLELLYRGRPELPVEHLSPMEPIRYIARDGLEIPAYLTLPRGLDPTNLPVVIAPHGGPWSRDTWGYDPYSQFLANRGYAVLQPNFRSSTGYGKAFLNAGNRTWGTGAMQHDITDGVTFTPELYACGVPYVAPSNIITLIESFDVSQVAPAAAGG